METREQWYKPNLLYNIHWRPPKKPEPPKMVVETVRFNPSVCTCGEHDCGPKYRMERRVLWTSKEVSTSKQSIREHIEPTDRDDCMGTQKSKQNNAMLNGVQNDIDEDIAQDKIKESNIGKNESVKEQACLKKGISEGNLLCGTSLNYRKEDPNGWKAHAYVKSCSNDDAEKDEHRKRDDINNIGTSGGVLEKNGRIVESCIYKFGESGDGVETNGCVELKLDDFVGNGKEFQTGVGREVACDKSSYMNGNGIETEAYVENGVKDFYDSNGTSLKPDNNRKSGIDIDISWKGIGLESSCQNKIEDSFGVRDGNIGNDRVADGDEHKCIGNYNDGIPINKEEFGGSENSVGEYDVTNDGGFESIAEISNGCNASSCEADGNGDDTGHEHYQVYDDQKNYIVDDGEISSAFGIFSIYCNSELHSVVQGAFSSEN